MKKVMNFLKGGTGKVYDLEIRTIRSDGETELSIPIRRRSYYSGRNGDLKYKHKPKGRIEQLIPSQILSDDMQAEMLKLRTKITRHGALKLDILNLPDYDVTEAIHQLEAGVPLRLEQDGVAYEFHLNEYAEDGGIQRNANSSSNARFDRIRFLNARYGRALSDIKNYINGDARDLSRFQEDYGEEWGAILREQCRAFLLPIKEEMANIYRRLISLSDAELNTQMASNDDKDRYQMKGFDIESFDQLDASFQELKTNIDKLVGWNPFFAEGSHPRKRIHRIRQSLSKDFQKVLRSEDNIDVIDDPETVLSEFESYIEQEKERIFSTEFLKINADNLITKLNELNEIDRAFNDKSIALEARVVDKDSLGPKLRAQQYEKVCTDFMAAIRAESLLPDASLSKIERILGSTNAIQNEVNVLEAMIDEDALDILYLEPVMVKLKGIEHVIVQDSCKELLESKAFTLFAARSRRLGMFDFSSIVKKFKFMSQVTARTKSPQAARHATLRRPEYEIAGHVKLKQSDEGWEVAFENYTDNSCTATVVFKGHEKYSGKNLESMPLPKAGSGAIQFLERGADYGTAAEPCTVIRVAVRGMGFKEVPLPESGYVKIPFGAFEIMEDYNGRYMEADYIEEKLKEKWSMGPVFLQDGEVVNEQNFDTYYKEHISEDA